MEIAAIICGCISVYSVLLYRHSIYDTKMKEETKRLAIDALKNNVELKINLNSGDLKELLK